MSDYDFRPGGSLKLKRKGADVEGGVTKKKKKKEKSRNLVDKAREQDVQEVVKESSAEGSAAGSGRNSPAVNSSSRPDDKKTDAERRFEEIQRRRMAEKVEKLAVRTHKDRVHEFNSKLEALSEHHDIPKVGPG